jgi:hypothetical protein
MGLSHRLHCVRFNHGQPDDPCALHGRSPRRTIPIRGDENGIILIGVDDQELILEVTNICFISGPRFVAARASP